MAIISVHLQRISKSHTMNWFSKQCCLLLVIWWENLKVKKNLLDKLFSNFSYFQFLKISHMLLYSVRWNCPNFFFSFFSKFSYFFKEFVFWQKKKENPKLQCHTPIWRKNFQTCIIDGILCNNQICFSPLQVDSR